MHLATASVFGENTWPEVEYILDHESGFDPTIVNPTSGACGLGQALGCSKMHCKLAVEDSECQVQWVIGYFQDHWHSDIEAAYQNKITKGWY